MPDIDSLRKIKADCVKTLLGMYKKANSGHIGASLSCLDILICLFFDRMKKEDKFILSKGHAAVALYTVLAKSGRFPESDLESFYKDGTLLAAHPPCSRMLEGVHFGTGSLGHGLSLAAGIALSNRFSGTKFKVYCVLSEGDCNEGSTWEAVMFAAHHKLANLVAIVDLNGQQALGYTGQVLSLQPLAERWRAFGWEVHEVDGHNVAALQETVAGFDTALGAPHVLIAHTTFGKGVSYMEGQIKWHYWPMSDAEYRQAVQEVEARP